MKKKNVPLKKSKTCAAESCRAKALADGDLCEKHQKQENAPPCSLSWDGEQCRRPQYAQGLCEPHYRRKLRNSTKWDKPIVPPRERIYIATRVTPEAHAVLEGSLSPGESLYSKLADIVDDWIRRNSSLRKAG